MSGETEEPSHQNRPRREPVVLFTTATVPFAYTVVGTNLWLWLLVASVLGVGITPYFYDQQRVVQLVVVLAVSLVVVIDRRVRTDVLRAFRHLPTAARTGLGVFFALGVVSAARAPIPAAAFREVGLFLLLAVLCFVVVSARRRAPTAFDRWALRLFIVTAATYALVFATTDLAVDRGSTMIGFDNPRVFGQVGLWLFPLLVTAALRGTGRPAVRLGRWLTVVAWWALIVEGGGRSALYGSLLGIAVAPFVVGKAGRAWLRSAVVVVLAGTALWFAWVSVIGHGTGGLLRAVEKGGDASGRFDMWADTLGLIAARPLLGVGPEHYAYHDTHLASPHNVPLQIAAEWGLPAALILAGLVVWGAIRWVAKQRRPPTAGPGGMTAEVDLAAGLTASVAAVGFASLLEGVVSSPPSQMLFVGVVGWALGVYLADRPATSHGPRLVSQAALAAGSLAAVGALAVGALPDALHPGREAAAYLDEHPDEPLAPRFWVQGRLVE